MTPAELEVWARDVIRTVLAGHDVEDGRVDCKASLVADPAKAARQIAALANAARAPEVLWLVGLDEKSHCATDASLEDLASWWPQVAKCFDGIPPQLMERRVATADHVVLALLWDTSGVPYVVPIGGGSDRFEVPWREGTRTRSARHGELLEILVPRLRVPTFELLRAELTVYEDPEKFAWRLVMPAYLEAGSPTIIPDHRTRARVELVRPGAEWSLDFDYAVIVAPSQHQMFGREPMPVSAASTIHQDIAQLVVNGPGRVEIRAGATRKHDRPDVSRFDCLRLVVSCQPVGSDLRAEVWADLELAELNPGDGNSPPVSTWRLRREV